MKTNPQSAFTLVELLAVIAIISILASLAGSGINAAREAGRQAACAANLRSMATAAVAYAEDHRGMFPWGQKRVNGYSSWCWDFIVPNGGTPMPGVMWESTGAGRVMQCPSFLGGDANFSDTPYTGYNYNCSFIGKVEGDPAKRTRPAKLADLRDPAATALFGDGEYAMGGNKFMRAPKRDSQYDGSSKSIREAGTQGFRHRGKTNMVFCDGHVESFDQPYKYGGEEGFVYGKCGFISDDNYLYSLEK